MNTTIRKKIAERQATRRCELSSCGRPVYRFSRYCRRHFKTYRRTGHPEGSSIPNQALEGPLSLARRWLEVNAEHPDVLKARSWLGEMIIEASCRRYRSGGSDELELISPWAKAHRRWFVDSRETLALVLAVFIHRAWEPRRYLRSDRYFALQLGDKVIRHVGHHHKAERKGEQSPWRGQGYVPVLPRLALSRLIHQNIGVFLLRAVEHLTKTPATLNKGTTS